MIPARFRVSRHAVGLLALFGLALLIRLALALTTDGLAFDVQLFRHWSERLIQRGPALFYEPGYFVDYPPGYLYVLLIVGKLSHAFTGGAAPVPLLKLPAIAADLALAWLAAIAVARVSPPGLSRSSTIRTAAAIAILFNPALILVSSVWGQADSILALFVLAGLYALGAGGPSLAREAAGIGLLAVVIGTKPQAVFALPIVAVLLIHRHLRTARSVHLGWPLLVARLAFFLGLGYLVIAIMFAPFGFGPSDIPAFYREAGSVYPFTSLWALNVWGVVGFYRPDVGSGAVTVGSVPAFYVGLVLFTIAVSAIAVRAWRSLEGGVDPAAVAVFGVVAVTCAAFTLLTRSHERYLYLAVAGLAPFVILRPLRWSFVLLSTCYFLNLHFVYVYFSQHAIPPGSAWTIQPLYEVLFGSARDAWQLKGLSALTAAACLALAGLGWHWLDVWLGPVHRPQASRTACAYEGLPARAGVRDALTH